MALTPPTLADRHARAVANGLTKHTLADVLTFYASAEAALAECRAAHQRCLAILDADPGYQRGRAFPLTREYIESPVALAAYDLLQTTGRCACPSFPRAGNEEWFTSSCKHGTDAYRLGFWAKQADAWRRWAARVRKMLPAE